MLKVQNIPREKSNTKVKKYHAWADNIKELASSDFYAILLSIILTLLQSFHPAIVLSSFKIFTNNIANAVFSYIVTAIIELFVLYYVMKKSKSVSQAFMIFSMLINIYYYSDKFRIIQGQWDYKFIPAILFSLIIPFSIYRVAEEIK